jgi:hypothetical protein
MAFGEISQRSPGASPSQGVSPFSAGRGEQTAARLAHATTDFVPPYLQASVTQDMTGTSSMVASGRVEQSAFESMVVIPQSMPMTRVTLFGPPQDAMTVTAQTSTLPAQPTSSGRNFVNRARVLVPETTGLEEDLGEATATVPVPAVADLIARFTPLDRETIEQALARVRDDLMEVARGPEGPVGVVRPIAWLGVAFAAIVAIRVKGRRERILMGQAAGRLPGIGLGGAL